MHWTTHKNNYVSSQTPERGYSSTASLFCLIPQGNISAIQWPISKWVSPSYSECPRGSLKNGILKNNINSWPYGDLYLFSPGQQKIDIF